MSPRKTAYTDSGRRHKFLFEIGGKITPVQANVRPGKGSFSITLTEDHVLKAIKANGFGDAQNCAGAICIRDHADMIPHKFTGYIDFWDSAAFIACRNNKINLPTHCVAWRHPRKDIAKLFDSKAGRQKLLGMVRENGPITIKFTPPVYRASGNSGPSGLSGSYNKRKQGPRGHRVRIERVATGVGGYLSRTGKIA